VSKMVSLNGIHICASQPSEVSIHRNKCPDCKIKSFFVGFFVGWYGWETTCLKCGREWLDGEWCALEFERGIRKRNIAHAKARYRNFKIGVSDEQAGNDA